MRLILSIDRSFGKQNTWKTHAKVFHYIIKSINTPKHVANTFSFLALDILLNLTIIFYDMFI